MSIPLQIMQDGFSLGRILGIRLNINQSALFLALMLSLNGFALFGFSAVSLLLVPLFALLFMASVVAHEYGHALTARAFGIQTQSITLHALGGVAKITSEPRTPGQEFLVAIAGPAVSIGLGGLFFLLFQLAGGIGLSIISGQLLFYLAIANLALGIFNMLPGLPLDGGRALRAAVWHFKRDRRSGTLVAAAGGGFIGMLFYVLAFLHLTSGNLGGAIFAGFMGWFLRSAAKAEKLRALSETRGFDPARSLFNLLRRMSAQQRRPRSQAGVPPFTAPPKDSQDDDVEVIRYPDGREVHIRRR